VLAATVALLGSDDRRVDVPFATSPDTGELVARDNDVATARALRVSYLTRGLAAQAVAVEIDAVADRVERAGIERRILIVAVARLEREAWQDGALPD
jgi:hypothetical protein